MDKVKCNHCDFENSTKAKYCSNCGHELPKVENVIVEKPEVKSVKRKVSIPQLIGLGVGILIAVLIQQYFRSNSSYDKEMMAIASELNKSCPLMVDAETRLDNAIAMPGNVFQYNYTLVNIAKSTVDTIEMKKFLEPTITNNVRTNPQMQYQRDHKTIMRYYYKDKSGQYLCMITVAPDKYE